MMSTVERIKQISNILSDTLMDDLSREDTSDYSLEGIASKYIECMLFDLSKKLYSLSSLKDVLSQEEYRDWLTSETGRNICFRNEKGWLTAPNYEGVGIIRSIAPKVRS
jgi:hypothetical protein